MSLFKTVTLTITRLTPGALVKGRYGTPTPSTFTAVGHLQPAGSRDLEKLEEGLRTKDVRLFMTKSVIIENDKTNIDGETFTAMAIEGFEGITNVGRNEILFVKDRGQ